VSAPETFCFLPFGNQVLAMTVQEFQVALERGLALAGSTATPPAANSDAPQRLCTAEQMEEHTGVPHGWFLEAARRGEIPHLRMGKYRRFDLHEVIVCSRFRSRAGQGAGGKAS